MAISPMGAESRCHAQLLIQRDIAEKKSEAGLSVTVTAWQGPRDWGANGVSWQGGPDATMLEGKR